MSSTPKGIRSEDLCNNYLRPNLNWECGHLAQGCPCTFGPTFKGKCTASAECVPNITEGAWQCSRPQHRGGVCQTGPDKDGKCCHTHTVCVPTRSLRLKRKVFGFSMACIALGFLLIVFGSGRQKEFIVPGPLSSKHAALLIHKGDDRCAECHANAHQSLGQWIGSIFGVSGNDPTATHSQSDLCLKCHQTNLKSQFALVAHGLPPKHLETVTQHTRETATDGQSWTLAVLGRSFQPGQELSCSTCHREHHGKQVDMRAMTDAQCQSCHSATFHSFELDHPEFKNWPKQSQRSIAFDHNSHGLKHFVQASKTFTCRACHQDDPAGNVKTLVSFEVGCASCHQRAIELSADSPLAFLQLPMINSQVFTDAGIPIGEWPKDISVDFDGQLPAIMSLLLQADPKVSRGLNLLGPNFDLLDLDTENKEQLAAVASIVMGVKRLMVDFSWRGHEAIRQRLQVVFDQKLDDEDLKGLAHGLSPAIFQDARKKWFPSILSEVDLNDCFPRYAGQTHTAIIDSENPVYGKLKLFRDLLASNPLAGQFSNANAPSQTPSASDSQNPLPTGKQNVETVAPQRQVPSNNLSQRQSTNRPAAKPSPKHSRLQENAPSKTGRQTQPSIDSNDLLAENPLAAIPSVTSNSQPQPTQTTQQTGPKTSSQASQAPAPIAEPSPSRTTQEFPVRPPILVNPAERLAENPLNSQPPNAVAPNAVAPNAVAPNAVAPAQSAQNNLAVSNTPDNNAPTAGNNRAVRLPPTPPANLANHSKVVGSADNGSSPDQNFDTRTDQSRALLQAPEIDARMLGWGRDDQAFAISYKIQGHADTWATHWINLAAQQKLKSGQGQPLAAELFNRLGSKDSPGNCMQCHQLKRVRSTTPVNHPDNLVAQNEVDSLDVSDVDRNLVRDEGTQLVRDQGTNKLPAIFASATLSTQENHSPAMGLKASSKVATWQTISRANPEWKQGSRKSNLGVSWVASYRNPNIRQFTKFNHAPHMLQPVLNDCSSCHQLLETPFSASTSDVSPDPQDQNFESCKSDFHAILRHRCDSCHRANGNSNSCTTCHSYHIGSQVLR